MQPDIAQTATPKGESNTPSERSDFERAAREQGISLFREFLQFLAYNKKWWLLPVLMILLLVGALVFLSSTAAAPFIYTLF